MFGTARPRTGSVLEESGARVFGSAVIREDQFRFSNPFEPETT